jgi:hypothetical protein
MERTLRALKGESALGQYCTGTSFAPWFLKNLMVFDTECMLADPVSMLDRCEREKQEALLERHQHVDRCLAELASAQLRVWKRFAVRDKEALVCPQALRKA